MTEATGVRRFDVLFNEDVASPAGSAVWTGRRRAAQGVAAGPATRVMTEVYLRHGGKGTRALLGGTFDPDTASDVMVVQMLAERLPITSTRTDLCPSRLGRPLLCGLPADLADAALSGLVGSGEPRLPGGVLSIDRAAHDQIDSSEYAFRLIGDFLVFMMAARIAGADIDQEARRYEDQLREPGP